MASFSTAFSGDGSKFAVASQEGLVAVWDVRSTKPLKVFETDKSRTPRREGNGEASGWLSDEIFEWSGSSFRAPGWSVRNVKFGGSGDKEIMTFTEVRLLLLKGPRSLNLALVIAHFSSARRGRPYVRDGTDRPCA